MLAPLDPLDAYRADQHAQGPGASVADVHAAWLLVASLVHDMAARSGVDRHRARGHLAAAAARNWAGSGLALSAPLLQTLATLGDTPGHADDAAEATAALRTVVDEVERAGLFHLAYTLLADAERAFAESHPVSRGWLRVQRARVARQLGALDAAQTLYEGAIELGDAGVDVALVGRAWVGLAVIANMRGNYPAAREACAAALHRAGHVPSVSAVAHHALLVGAVARGDVDAALQHGWRAFEQAAGDADQRAEALLNLASVAQTAGEPEAALRGFQAALRLTAAPRLRLPALRGTALAAAAVRDRARFDAAAAAVAVEGPAAGQPYEYAMSLVALAEGTAAFGDGSRGRAFAAAALAAAAPHGFREVEYRADAVVSAEEAALGRRTRRPGAEPAPAVHLSGADRDAGPARHAALSAPAMSVVDNLLGMGDAIQLAVLVG